MDIIWIIIVVPFAVVSFIAISFVIGHGFRHWNEGERYIKDNSKGSFKKTVAIGFVIFIILAFIVSQCEGLLLK